MMPFLIGGLAVLLLVVGIIILVVWFTGPNRPAIGLLASKTPTPTNTGTATPETPTLTPSTTPTITETPTETATSTREGPMEYEVKEGESCWLIAQNFEIELDLLIALNGTKCDTLQPGDKLLIPAPGQELPTETPIPTDLARGTEIQYRVKSGETLALLASRYNSTLDAILTATNRYNKANGLDEITDVNSIQAGWILIIPVNIVTPTVTLVPSSTAANTPTPGAATATP